MLLSCKHEDRKDKLAGEEHLDDCPLGDRRCCIEGRADVELAGEEGANDGGCDYAADYLCCEEEDAASYCDVLDQDHAECYCWVCNWLISAFEIGGIGCKAY